MTNEEIAEILEEIADFIELREEDEGFRANAYRRAARSVRESSIPVKELGKQNRLTALPHVGASIAGRIAEILEKGYSPYLEELKEGYPETLLELLAIPGLGPKKVGRLYRKLGVATLTDLEQASLSGRIRNLPGFGPKSESNILENIELYRKLRGRLPIFEADTLVEELLKQMGQCSAIQKLTPVGSHRRRCATVGNINLIAILSDPKETLSFLSRLPLVEEKHLLGEGEITFTLRSGYQVDLQGVPETLFGFSLLYYTGSREHNHQIQDLAQQRGYRFSKAGLISERTGETLPCETEEEVYHLLGLPWIPPEIREGTGEVEKALQGELPCLVTSEDWRGDFHLHTHWSDGASSLLEMALMARELRYEYLVITDHSPSRAHAGGLTIERLRQQSEALREVQHQVPEVRLLHGLEVDIHPDGTLDLPDEILSQLDFVVASVHSAMRQEAGQMTQRLIRALKNPYVNLLGHPTGRIPGSRESYRFDLSAIFEVALETGTALEINGARLDLEGPLARQFKDQGGLLAVNTDAHRASHLSFFRRYAIDQARKAWLEPQNVLNTWPLEQVLEWVKTKRGR